MTLAATKQQQGPFRQAFSYHCGVEFCTVRCVKSLEHDGFFQSVHQEGCHAKLLSFLEQHFLGIAYLDVVESLTIRRARENQWLHPERDQYSLLIGIQLCELTCRQSNAWASLISCQQILSAFPADVLKLGLGLRPKAVGDFGFQPLQHRANLSIDPTRQPAGDRGSAVTK